MAEQPTNKKISLFELLTSNLLWNNYTDTSQIPRDNLRRPETPEEAENSPYEYDPFNIIVGHRKEIEILKATVLEYARKCLMIKNRRSELAAKGMEERFPPGNCIEDKLAEEFRPAMCIALGGPYGSGKTLLTRCAAEYYQDEKKKFGITGEDLLVVYDSESLYKFKMLRLDHPRGEDLYNKFLRRKAELKALKKVGKWTAISATMLTTTYFFVDLALSTLWEAPWFGLDPLTWILDWLVSELPYISAAAITAGIPSALLMLKNYFNRNTSKEPRLLSSGGDKVSPYLGQEKLEKLLGSYNENNHEVPPQARLHRSDALLAHYNILSVENAHALSAEVMGGLAQLMEECKFNPAYLPEEFRMFVYPLYLMSFNTDQAANILPALMNRFNNGVKMSVVNAVEENEEGLSGSYARDLNKYHKYRELNGRHLIVFLSNLLDKFGGKDWERAAAEEFVDYSARLADNSTNLHISRRVIGIPALAERYRRLDGSPLVKLEHVLLAEKDARSIAQSFMDQRLDMYKQERAVNTSGKTVGRVNVSLNYHGDFSSSEIAVPGIPKEIYDYVQTEEFVGYTTSISAVAVKANEGKPSFDIVTRDASLNKEYLKSALTYLFSKEKVNLDEYKVSLSVPSLVDDEALVSGAYVALRSAISNVPIRQDTCLLTRILETGEVTSMPRLNYRLIDLDKNLKRVIVSKYDFDHKIINKNGKRLYNNIEVATASSLDDVMGALT